MVQDTSYGAFGAEVDLSEMANLADGKIIVGSATNRPAAVTPSGDLVMSNAGVLSFNGAIIVSADIAAGAAIAWSQMAALASGHILVGSAGNVATDVALSGDISITNAGVTAIVNGLKYVGTVSWTDVTAGGTISGLSGQKTYLMVYYAIDGTTGTNTNSIYMRFNADSGANYFYNAISNNAVATTGGASQIKLCGDNGTGANEDYFGHYIMVCKNTTQAAGAMMTGMSTERGGGMDDCLKAGWTSDSAVTSITVYSAFKTTGVLTLWELVPLT